MNVPFALTGRIPERFQEVPRLNQPAAERSIPGRILLGLFLCTVFTVCWARPAAALGPAVRGAGLRLTGDFASDLAPAAGEADAQDARGFLPDLCRLYEEPAGIGAREAGAWLGAVALLVRYDQPLYDWFNDRLDAPWAGDAAEIFGSYALPLVAIGLAWSGDPEVGLACGEAVAFALLNTQALKCVLGMARPYTGEGPVFAGPAWDDTHWAMPSGHTAAAFALATVLADEYPRWKWVYYTCAALVGLARIRTGDHWPSNVLAGSLLGIHAGQRVLGREFTVFKWKF